MKNCPFCNAPVADTAVFCPVCGKNMAPANSQNPTPNPMPNQYQNQGYSQTNQIPYAAPAAPVFDPYDHTEEFDKKDVSDNKVYAMLLYLMSTVGLIIALLASPSSPYLKFHVRQAVKFLVAEILLGIATVILAITVIVPIAAAVCLIIIFVLKIIAFFQICAGKSKEPAIIRNISFLK